MQHSHQTIARDLLKLALDGAIRPTAKEAGFLGQMAFDANEPTDKQANWLEKLAARYGKEVRS